MPPIDLTGSNNNGKNRVSLLEGAIITWTKQIRSVLKQDPESQLKAGMHPTPDVEMVSKPSVHICTRSPDRQLSLPRLVVHDP
jgi:hypothetical protein